MKKPIVVMLSALMLGMSATAMAGPNHHGGGQYRSDNHHSRYDNHRYDHRNDRNGPPKWAYLDRGNHYGHDMRFKRGDRIPYQYRSSRYYISDWRHHHHLYAPPRGYRWMYLGGNYLLVSTSNFSIRVVL